MPLPCCSRSVASLKAPRCLCNGGARRCLCELGGGLWCLRVEALGPRVAIFKAPRCLCNRDRPRSPRRGHPVAIFKASRCLCECGSRQRDRTRCPRRELQGVAMPLRTASTPPAMRMEAKSRSSRRRDASAMRAADRRTRSCLARRDLQGAAMPLQWVACGIMREHHLLGHALERVDASRSSRRRDASALSLPT
jgi:hypothetical protein